MWGFACPYAVGNLPDRPINKMYVKEIDPSKNPIHFHALEPSLLSVGNRKGDNPEKILQKVWSSDCQYE